MPYTRVGNHGPRRKNPKSGNKDFTLGHSCLAAEHIRGCRTGCRCRCSGGPRWHRGCRRGRFRCWRRRCRDGCGFFIWLFRTAGFPVMSFVTGSTGCSPCRVLAVALAVLLSISLTECGGSRFGRVGAAVSLTFGAFVENAGSFVLTSEDFAAGSVIIGSCTFEVVL